MGEAALVESQVGDAFELIRKLDAADLSPTLAVWYFYDDASDWRLVLAGPGFDEFLPGRESIAYRKVAQTMSETAASSLSVSDIKIVHSQSPLPATIRVLISTPPNAFMRSHFTNNFVNGIFIKEMIVLRCAEVEPIASIPAEPPAGVTRPEPHDACGPE